MRRRLLFGCVASLLASSLTLTAGCGNQSGGSEDGRDKNNSGEADPAEDKAGGNSTETAEGNRAGEPELVGKGLAIAKQRAEEGGFEVQAYDSAGRDRTPVVARSWQVCFQEPARAKEDGEVIRLGVVRTSENCPDEDGSRNLPELGSDNELPDFTGTTLQVATDALGSSASVNPVDARLERNIYIPQNWKVCDQSLQAGTRWDGEPITFQVVKYGERCP